VKVENRRFFISQIVQQVNLQILDRVHLLMLTQLFRRNPDLMTPRYLLYLTAQWLIVFFLFSTYVLSRWDIFEPVASGGI